MYSLGLANLQFALCDTQILCDNKFGKSRKHETATLAILEVLNFLFLEEIPHLKVLKIHNFSLWDTGILRKIKFGNFRRSKSAI